MNEGDLQARTKKFALRVMKLVDALPRTPSGRVIANQLARAACRGRSRAEFISKLGNVEEEADECALWMELAMEGGLVGTKKTQPLHDEATQLTAIMAASRITATRNKPIANRKSKIANRKN